MRKRAYLHSRGTTWPNTARAYMASFQRARQERMSQPKAAKQEDLGRTFQRTAARFKHGSSARHDR
jgi:CHASE3 domain sensor protein